ncbi:MAG: glycosyltransferase family 2 protein [Lachnospiraceae bacterium]|nr:glycosyltransferase family 2 protein [Lachnospiraceae bacterium]
MFAICAYGDSPYLEACIRSLKAQSCPAPIILCTSTPSTFLESMAANYGLPYHVREGDGGIARDWNFALECADARLVTIAHQDDRYHRQYARWVQWVWGRHPDTSVMMTDAVVVRDVAREPGGDAPTARAKGGVGNTPSKIKPARADIYCAIKRLLRLPLRFRTWCDRAWVKRAALVLGNPIFCPSCTYDKEMVGQGLFDASYRFALDWDALWRLAEAPGRFVCLEKPLLCYRIHGGAATKASIEDHSRREEELRMFRRIWPAPVAALLGRCYGAAQGSYKEH